MEKQQMFLTGDLEKDTRRVTYLIFISAVALLSFVVALGYYIVSDQEIKQVLLTLDVFYALVFFVDFILRLRTVPDRRQYLLTFGWLDFVTCVPGFPVLRIIRSVSVLRDTQQILAVTPEEIEDQARTRLAESVLLVTVFIGLIILTVGSIAIVVVEADAPDATITTGFDAIWWSLVTVSTVGYGDEVPVTVPGRIVGIFMLLVGVALFTTITSFLASTFTDRTARQQRAEQIELSKRQQQQIEELLEHVLFLEEKIAERLDIDDDLYDQDQDQDQ
jgi:voltage-gated potassium channel Kch